MSDTDVIALEQNELRLAYLLFMASSPGAAGVIGRLA